MLVFVDMNLLNNYSIKIAQNLILNNMIHMITKPESFRTTPKKHFGVKFVWGTDATLHLSGLQWPPNYFFLSLFIPLSRFYCFTGSFDLNFWKCLFLSLYPSSLFTTLSLWIPNIQPKFCISQHVEVRSPLEASLLQSRPVVRGYVSWLAWYLEWHRHSRSKKAS